MKVVVTGASGFIGSALIKGLIQCGHEVIALTRSGEAESNIDSLTWISGKLDERSALQISAYAPDACIHCAWVATPGEYLNSPENENLVSSSFQFLKTLSENGLNHITALGSCIEYDLTIPGPYSETESRLVPQSPYARAKVQLHQMLKSELNQMATICWARIFFPYGCGEHPNRLPTWLIQQFLNGQNPQLKTPADRNDYLHINDVVQALIIATEKGCNGPLNIGAGQGLVISDIFKLIAQKLGKEGLQQSCEQKIPAKSIIADNTKLRTLGWDARVTIDEGIQELITSISSQSNANRLNS